MTSASWPWLLPDWPLLWTPHSPDPWPRLTGGAAYSGSGLMGYNYYWFYIQSPAIILIHSPHRLASLQQRFCSGASHACVGRPKAKFSAPKRLKPGMMGKKGKSSIWPWVGGEQSRPCLPISILLCEARARPPPVSPWEQVEGEEMENKEQRREN